MRVTVTLHVNPNETHDDPLACIKWAILDGFVDHFNFYDRDLSMEDTYDIMEMHGFYVEDVSFAEPQVN